MDLKRITEGHKLVTQAMNRKYTCVICGAENLNLSTIINNAYFKTNTLKGYTDASLANYMVVCSDECRKLYILKDKIPYESLMDGVDIPSRFLYKTLHLFQHSSALHSDILEWLNDIKKGLFITGNTGTGKTTLASAIAYELRKREYRVRFCRSTDIAMMANGVKNLQDIITYLKELNTYDFIIIDDITKHTFINNGHEAFYNIYSHLYDNNKKIIVTSNFTIDGVTEQLDPRLGSRLYEMCSLITMAGSDKRLKEHV